MPGRTNMALIVGDKFDDYASCKVRIAELERNTDSVFVVDQCTQVEESNKLIRKPEKRHKAAFKHSYVKLVCKRYGTLRTQTTTKSSEKACI